MTNELITAGEVAKLLGVSPRTVTRWSRQGLLEPTFVTPGGHRRYHKAEVERFMAEARLRAHDQIEPTA